MDDIKEILFMLIAAAIITAIIACPAYFLFKYWSYWGIGIYAIFFIVLSSLAANED